jgi:hypothetical protein
MDLDKANKLTLSQLKDGRTREELDALKDGVLVVASNMYYDDKISNGEYNSICGALIQIRDILDAADARRSRSGN